MGIVGVLATALALATDLPAAQGFSPHYEVKATVDTAHSSLSAAVKITIAASEVQAVNEFLLGGTYEVSSVDAGPRATVGVGRTDKPLPGLQKITVRCQLPRRDDLRLQVRYAGLLTSLDAPPLNSITPDLIELSLDSFWLPVGNGFKRFTVNADIRGVPTDLVVVGPGSVRRSGGHVLIRRPTGDVDLAFVAMRGLQHAAAEGFELYAADLSAEASKTDLRQGAAVVAFLEAWFGTMPGRPARVVVVRRQRKSGYSRLGYIVMTEGGTQREAELAQFMAHEFAHAWWAPCDPRTEHRWLSESIAEYVALRYIEAALGPTALEEALASKRDMARKAGPLLGAGEGDDAELYSKGPLLLFDLETRIGRARMNELLAGLARDPPRVTAEFMRALTALAGEGPARVFEQAMRQ